MIDLYLRASSEKDLAEALPMLRATNETGAPIWVDGGQLLAIDAGFPVIEQEAVHDGDGREIRPAIVSDSYHLNLRIFDEHPDKRRILLAAEPFRIDATTTTRKFAGGDETKSVPAEISDRQFAQVLAMRGAISQGEALAWAARGELPNAIEQALQAIPEEGGQRFGARMLLSSATLFERAHPLVGVFGEMLGYGEGELDRIWQQAATL